MKMSDDTRALLMSPGYIDVNQDSLGVPGRRLRIGDRNSAEVWGKPLADHSFACVLWFRNQTQAIHHRTSKRLHSGSIERACLHACICVWHPHKVNRDGARTLINILYSG